MAESDEEERPLSNAKSESAVFYIQSPFAATEEEEEEKKKKKNMKSRKSVGGWVDGWMARWVDGYMYSGGLYRSAVNKRIYTKTWALTALQYT